MRDQHSHINDTNDVTESLPSQNSSLMFIDVTINLMHVYIKTLAIQNSMLFLFYDRSYSCSSYELSVHCLNFFVAINNIFIIESLLFII